MHITVTLVWVGYEILSIVWMEGLAHEMNRYWKIIPVVVVGLGVASYGGHAEYQQAIQIDAIQSTGKDTNQSVHVWLDAYQAQKEADSIDPNGPIQTLKRDTLKFVFSLMLPVGDVQAKMAMHLSDKALQQRVIVQAAEEATNLVRDYNLTYSKQVADLRQRLFRAGQTKWDNDDDFYVTVYNVNQIYIILRQLDSHAKALK
jgi:hypothetical protein